MITKKELEQLHMLLNKLFSGGIILSNIETIEAKPKSIWFLDDEDEYWYIDDQGFVIKSDTHSATSLDNRLNNGNVFLSKEDARIEQQKRQVEALIKKYGGIPFQKCDHSEYDYEERFHQYVLVTGIDEDEYNINPYHLNESEHFCIEDAVPFVFESLDAANNAVEKIGQKRLIAYMNSEVFFE
jgi:hypothetical protein